MSNTSIKNATYGNKQVSKPKLNRELIGDFWAAPDEAFFDQETISLVIVCSTQKLERDRWLHIGIPYCKLGRRVLYRKSDVIAWIEKNLFVKCKRNQK